MQGRRLSLIALLIASMGVALVSTQGRPGQFSTIQSTDTTSASLLVGCAPNVVTGCTGGAVIGSAQFTTGIATDGATVPTHGIGIASAVPSSTSFVLYNNAGTLTWNGTPLAAGSSLSGTTGTIPIFTASNAVGNSLITSAASVYTMTGTWNVTVAYQLGGTSINTSPTLSNVAYDDYNNYFTNTSGNRFKAGLAIDDATPSTHGIAMASAVPGSVLTNLFNNSSTLTWQGAATTDVGFQIGSPGAQSNNKTFLTLAGSNAATNWQIAANVAANAVTWTPSTAGGGVTFTTPVMTLTTSILTTTTSVTAGSGAVAITDSTGKLAVFDSTHYQNLSGANFTNLPAGQLSGLVALANGGLNVNNASAGSGTFPRGNGTGFAVSTLTLPNAATTGDIMIATGSNAIGNLADVAAGSYLRSGGTSTAPLWSTLVLPNSSTSTRVVYSTGTNTYGESGNLTFNGTNLAVGGGLGLAGSIAGSKILAMAGAAPTASAAELAISIDNFNPSTTATTSSGIMSAGISTAAGSYTTSDVFAWGLNGIAKGAGHTITRAWDVALADVTAGTNNVLLYMGGSPGLGTTFTGNWAIYQNTTKASYFNGGIRIGDAFDPGAGNLAVMTGGTGVLITGSTSTITFNTSSSSLSTNSWVGSNASGVSFTSWTGFTVTTSVAGTIALSANAGGSITHSVSGGGVVSFSIGGGGSEFQISGLGSSTGTTLIIDGSNNVLKQTSSARYKEHIEEWGVSSDALTAFVALRPMSWDYIGGHQGAASFIADDLAKLPIVNAYGRSPLVNYDNQGRPDSNRDFAIIALQHLVLQDHDARILDLEREVASLRRQIH